MKMTTVSRNNWGKAAVFGIIAVVILVSYANAADYGESITISGYLNGLVNGSNIRGGSGTDGTQNTTLTNIQNAMNATNTSSASNATYANNTLNTLGMNDSSDRAYVNNSLLRIANVSSCTGTDKITSNGTHLTCATDQNTGTGGGGGNITAFWLINKSGSDTIAWDGSGNERYRGTSDYVFNETLGNTPRGLIHIAEGSYTLNGILRMNATGSGFILEGEGSRTQILSTMNNGSAVINVTTGAAINEIIIRDMLISSNKTDSPYRNVAFISFNNVHHWELKNLQLLYTTGNAVNLTASYDGKVDNVIMDKNGVGIYARASGGDGNNMIDVLSTTVADSTTGCFDFDTAYVLGFKNSECLNSGGSTNASYGFKFTNVQAVTIENSLLSNKFSHMIEASNVKNLTVRNNYMTGNALQSCLSGSVVGWVFDNNFISNCVITVTGLPVTDVASNSYVTDSPIRTINAPILVGQDANGYNIRFYLADSTLTNIYNIYSSSTLVTWSAPGNGVAQRFVNSGGDGLKVLEEGHTVAGGQVELTDSSYDGAGDGFLCVNATGVAFRKATACA